MVVAQKVEEPVGEQVGHLVDEWSSPRARLPQRRIERDDDVAQETRRASRARSGVHRKREDIGRFRLATMLSVELLDVHVVGQKDAELALGDTETFEHALRPVAKAPLIETGRAPRVSRDERGHAIGYSFGIFLASSRNLARPMSVSGCLRSCPITLNGIVQMSAPSTAACTTCTGCRTLATRTSVA